jgi:hypothetical protein
VATKIVKTVSEAACKQRARKRSLACRLKGASPNGAPSRLSRRNTQKREPPQAAHPALRSGNPAQEASTRPPAKHRLGGALKIQSRATAPACMAELITTAIIVISRPMSSDPWTRSRGNRPFFPAGAEGCAAFFGSAGRILEPVLLSGRALLVRAKCRRSHVRQPPFPNSQPAWSPTDRARQSSSNR